MHVTGAQDGTGADTWSPERRFRLQEDYRQTSNSEITTFTTNLANEFLLELVFFFPCNFWRQAKTPNHSDR